jgi:protocatechuate 3,4-dioxygenase beta subunit
MPLNKVGTALAAIATMSLMAQSPPAEPPPGNIVGVVTAGFGGKPLASVAVSTSAGSRQFRAVTDEQGRYVLRGLPPGKYTVESRGPATDRKTVTLGPGEVTQLDFRLFGPPGTISGRVVDEDKAPMPGMFVALLAKVYFSGEAGYLPLATDRSNEKGEYHLVAASPTDEYLVMARAAPPTLDYAEDAPAESELRTPAVLTTVYPNSRSVDGGAPVTVHPGENREGLDIRVAHSPSYCIEGKAEAPGKPAPLFLQIIEREPPSTSIPAAQDPLSPSHVLTHPDGSFRVCGLHSGEYLLTAFSGDLSAAMPVAIGNQDIQGIHLIAREGARIPGQVVWDGIAPQNPVGSRISILVGAWGRGMRIGIADAPLPGAFTISGIVGGGVMAVDSFEYRVEGLPKRTYLKDIAYGGVSVMGKRLRVGSIVGDTELRIVVGQDGGSLTANVLDRSGKPVYGSYVTVVREGAHTEGDLSVDFHSGRIDDTGAYFSGTVKPGKYLVLSTDTQFNTSAGSLAVLSRVLMRAKPVEISPNGAVHVTLEPVAID